MIKKNNLLDSYPELAAEWDYEKNDLGPEYYSKGSAQNVWWKCSKGHSYLTSINHRTNGIIDGKPKRNCPFCSGQKILTGFNDFKTWCIDNDREDMLSEWDYDKNKELTPELIAPHSDKKVWWKCKKGHSYCAKTDSRTRMKSGCPYCAGKKVLQGDNDLKTAFPEISKEWDYVNNELPPENYMPKSNKVVSWICPICNESYKRKVIERTNKGFGCKYCMGEKHTSRQEQTLIFYFSKVVSVENRIKLFGKEVDVYIPELNVGIEYNGEYFHQDKVEKDAKKIRHLQDGISIKMMFRLKMY